MADIVLERSSKTFKDRARIDTFGNSYSGLRLFCNHKGLDALHRTFKYLGINGTSNADSQFTIASLIALRRLVREEVASSYAAKAAGILWERVTNGHLEHLLSEEVDLD